MTTRYSSTAEEQQQLAEAYARAVGEVTHATKERDAAEFRLQTAQKKRGELLLKLEQITGPNITRKAFHVGPEIVLVQYNHERKLGDVCVVPIQVSDAQNAR